MAAIRPQDLKVTELTPQTASDAEWQALDTLLTRLHVERQPEDPPNSLEIRKAQFLGLPSYVLIRPLLAWSPDGSEAIAFGLGSTSTEENQHMLQVQGGVAPEWRRQGIGSMLLEQLVDWAHSQGRRLMIAGTRGTVPSGAAFMARIGAAVAIEGHENRLDLTELSHDLVADWLRRGAERNPGVEMGLWEGDYPEDDLEEIARLMESTNLQPLGELDTEDEQFTPERLRERQETLASLGAERWTVYVRDTTSGELAGFTEVFWRPDKPAYLEQGFTAVWPQYRNRGFGRWLKAAMLDKVLRERPQARYVITGNADSNAAMLKINDELGFKPHVSEILWQVDLAKVREFLASRAGKEERDVGN